MAKDNRPLEGIGPQVSAEPQVAGNQSPPANTDLAGRVAQLETLLTGLMALMQAQQQQRASDALPVNIKRVMVDKTNEKLQRIDDNIRAAEEELKQGPRQFEVTLTGEPRMTRTVGASDDLHAKLKYQRFFGIRNFAGLKELLARPLETPVSATV